MTDAIPSAVSVSAGEVLGGRFEVRSTTRTDALGAVVHALDRKTGKPIGVRILKSELATREAVATKVREYCKLASTLQHKNVIATYGVGADKSGALFIAFEWVDGLALPALIERRRRAGSQLSLRGAYNVIAHTCRALSHAEPKTFHGGLRPGTIWISRSGRVKIAEFGLARAMIETAGVSAFDAEDSACFAPEIKAGGAPTAKSDIFGLGAVLYEMLTGKSPAQGFVAPSKVHPDATRDLDKLLLCCLEADPNKRFATPEEMRKTLCTLAVDAPEVSAAEDFGMDIDVDVELGSMRPPQEVAGGAPPTAPGGAPRVGSRVSLHDEFRTSNSQNPQGPAPAGRTSSPGRRSAEPVDLAGLLAQITVNDAPRWMVVKGGLDHGPFSGRELVDLILKGETQRDHGLMNMDTGERRTVGGTPEFTEFLDQYELRRRAAEQRAEIEKSKKAERTGNAMKVVIALSIIGALGLVVGVYLWTRPDAADRKHADALASLYDSGEINVEGAAGILPDPPRRRSRSGGRSAGSSASRGGGSMSYDEAMNQAMDLGDATQGGGEQRLSSADVAGIMNRNINKLFACVSQELRSGGSLERVELHIAILGSGQVAGASAQQGSPSFRRCIEAKVTSVRFPSFSAPRMGARYYFDVE